MGVGKTRRLRRDSILACNALLRVYVYLHERHAAGLGLVGGELREDGRNGLARPTPVGVEVGDDISIGAEKSVEVRGRGDSTDCHGY